MAEAADPAEVQFDYSARDAAGRRKRGRIAARDRSEAMQLVRAQGLYPVEVALATQATRARSQPIRTGQAPVRLTARQRADLIARLAKLTASRISLDRALSIMADGRDGA